MIDLRANRYSALLLAAALLVSPFASFAAEEPTTAPRSSRTPILYRLLDKMAKGIDGRIAGALKLEPVACEFRDDVKKRTFHHKGLGICLYRSWLSGHKTDDVPGTITVTFRPEADPEAVIEAELAWRSAAGNLWDSLSRITQTRMDKGVPIEMRDETFPGTVTVRFLTPVPPRYVLRGADRLIFIGRAGNLERLELTSAHDEQTGREMHGSLLLYLEGSEKPSYAVSYRTDKNVFKRRPYWLELEGQ